MKTTWLASFFCILFFLASGQDHKTLNNKYWEIINSKTYKADAVKRQYVPVYPPALRALSGKTVVLPGYMIPVKTGLVYNTFLLAVLPVSQCRFCGQGDVPDMVEVTTSSTVKYSDNIISVTGVFRINEADQNRLEFQVEKATVKEAGL